MMDLHAVFQCEKGKKSIEFCVCCIYLLSVLLHSKPGCLSGLSHLMEGLGEKLGNNS